MSATFCDGGPRLGQMAVGVARAFFVVVVALQAPTSRGGLTTDSFDRASSYGVADFKDPSRTLLYCILSVHVLTCG